MNCCSFTTTNSPPPGQSPSAKNSEPKRKSKSINTGTTKKVNNQQQQPGLVPRPTISTLASSQPEEFPYRATPPPPPSVPPIAQFPPQLPPIPLAYQPLPHQSVSNLQRRTTTRSSRRSNNSSSENIHSPFLQNVNQHASYYPHPQRPEPVYGNGNYYQYQQPSSSLLSTSPSPYGIEMNSNSINNVNGSIRNRGNSTGASTYQPERSSGLREESRRIAIGGGVESEEGKLSVGIDFGTTYSGVAYGNMRLYSGGIRQLLNWPGSYETYRKIPSCILYAQASPNEAARIISWGLKAKSSPVLPGTIKCEWFKLFLSPESLRSGRPDERLPPLPYGKQPVDVICDFLGCLWRYAKEQITLEIGSVADLDSADVLLTVPAAWDAAGCALMREAAIRAGLVQSSRGGDVNWRDRLRIITEPEAAGIHASTLSSLHRLRPSQTFVIADLGGGTCDTAVYRILGQLSQLEIAEVCVRSGSNCGSLFVDLKFEELVRRILKDHPIHLDTPSMDAFMHAFCETDKLAYRGDPEDDAALFRFNCFNTLDSYDPAIGLEHGELAIPGYVLKTEVFDPIIQQVLSLIALQISKVPTLHIDAIILVGGFAASEYLFRRVQEVFGGEAPGKIGVIARPMDCDVATLQGAARYGLGVREGKVAVSNVISPRGYIIKVKLPVEMVDRIQRPQFIIKNDAGVEVCTNRASYLVARGAVLKKGGRLRSRFCKYANGPSDSFFQAVLYVSDSDSIYRYTDEGEIAELCRWNVDLAALPAFHRVTQRGGGGYVEFDLGLELDSAEVRGVLLTDEGIECGRGRICST